MHRVCLAIGPWQIVMLAAALEQRDHDAAGPNGTEDTLVLYENSGASAAFKQAMIDVAWRVRAWSRVIWADDLFEWEAMLGKNGKYADYQARLRERIGASVVDARELWCGKVTAYPERIVSDLYPDAPIYIYEDGLGTYIPRQPYRDELTGQPYPLTTRAVKALKRRIDDLVPSRRFLHTSGRYLHRIAGLYLSIAREVTVPPPYNVAPLFLIDNEVLRCVLARCATLPDVIAARESRLSVSERSSALVLAQTFYKWKVLSRAQEADVYRGVIDKLLLGGYDVLWKEHPRASEPFYPDMAAAFGPDRVRSVALPFTLPVEFVAPYLDVSAWVAGGSSSLYYLSRLYNLQAYSFAADFVPFLSGDSRRIVETAGQLVPSMEGVPSQTVGVPTQVDVV